MKRFVACFIPEKNAMKKEPDWNLGNKLSKFVDRFAYQLDFSLEQKQLVFEVLKSLNKVGFIIILVSHKLDEVLDLCQEATILKRGEIVSTVQLPCPSDQIINLMFDSKFSAKTNNEKENSKKSELGSILINFSKKPKSIQYYDQDINFPCGKTTGVIGLQGSGADQFIRECFSGKINITIKNENSDNFIPEKYFYYTPSDRLEKGYSMN